MSSSTPNSPVEESPATRFRLHWWQIGLVAAVAWVLFLQVFGPKPGMGPIGPAGNLPAPRLVNETGPRQLDDYQWRLLDLKGGLVDFKGFAGKVVFLNVWATWCPPCVAELPSIANLVSNSNLKTEDMVFLCVSVDDSPETARRFLQEKKLDLPVYTPAAGLPRAFQTEGIPATFVVGKDGRLLVAEMGAARWDAPEVVDFLKSQLAKTTQ